MGFIHHTKFVVNTPSNGHCSPQQQQKLAIFYDAIAESLPDMLGFVGSSMHLMHLFGLSTNDTFWHSFH